MIFKLGGQESEPLETIVVTDNIKQIAPLYALYGFIFLSISFNLKRLKNATSINITIL
ncbi:MAG: hypothetical protein HC803_10300 [Saprospiraceae bacterium]|nr:hypothetical protein [Saprospiraceae bacterium]